MLKVELFYWAMDVNCHSPVGLGRCRGVGHLRFYLPRVLFDCSVFLPREFATHEEKKANVRGLARGTWALLELTDTYL